MAKKRDIRKIGFVIALLLLAVVIATTGLSSEPATISTDEKVDTSITGEVALNIEEPVNVTVVATDELVMSSEW